MPRPIGIPHQTHAGAIRPIERFIRRPVPSLYIVIFCITLVNAQCFHCLRLRLGDYGGLRPGAMARLSFICIPFFCAARRQHAQKPPEGSPADEWQQAFSFALTYISLHLSWHGLYANINISYITTGQARSISRGLRIVCTILPLSAIQTGSDMIC